MSSTPDLKALNATSLYDLTDVVAVVTGGASGIGLMMASTLLANHARVYIVDLDAARTDSIAARYSKLALESGSRGSMVGIQGDCGSKAGAERIVEAIAQREEYVTCLFNNAGVMGEAVGKPKEATAEAFKETYFKLSDGSFQDTLAVNSIGPYFLSIAFLPLLCASKTKAPYGDRFQPQIVNTSSMNGWTKDPATAGFGYPYLLSKAAIAHMTSLLAHDFLPLGVRVNQIAPGWVVTGMSAPGTVDEWGVSSKQGAARGLWVQTPVGSSGSAKDFGSTALNLVANRFINGECILVDGGTLLVHPSKY
ncbi:NAD(P)-binding protein [Rhodotorula diobovata]|uniref:NAD(P)-binding protein n=1 Tax=Rhodotorula diobovata TaxID=5288 RepID=A0A5C5FYL8_9BASI|nr:NAD(P)-binding protein [Rhodotorula diobovata]